MADRTSIEWTDATWTPVKGCTRASEGCRNCYAEIMAARFSGPGQWGEGLAAIVETPSGKDHRWTGKTRLDEAELLKPLHWRKSRRVFVCSTADLFHETVPDEWIYDVFAVIERCPHHTFQILTKRSARMREFMTQLCRLPDQICSFYDLPTDGSCKLYQPIRNVWLGVSVEDQSHHQRMDDLRETPAFTRFVSFEPLLRPISADLTGIHWAIAGGESGPGARPMHPDWPRSLRDQCAAAGVPFFFKQWGDWAPHPSGDPVTIRQYHQQIGYIDRDTGERKRNPNRTSDETMRRIGKKAAGRLLDGIEHNGIPPR